MHLLFTSIDNARAFTQIAYEAMPQMYGLTPKTSSPCDIPEQDCPPRFFCDVTWEAIPEEPLALSIRVTNSAHSGKSFYAYSRPFQGPGAPASSITVAPSSISLAPGQTGIFHATYTVPAATPQGEYDAEIVVVVAVTGGYYQRAARVTLKVGCHQVCQERCCTCSVAMGEAPVRIHAHQWYHHFQCIETCDVQQGDLKTLLAQVHKQKQEVAATGSTSGSKVP
jgi:hypothetical protein